MNKKYILIKITVLNLLVVVFFTSFSVFAKATHPFIPEIISRSEWKADESKMTWSTKYAKIEKFVIHHTASSNLISDSDGSGEYKEMVNSIYNYHNGKKNWYDDNIEYTGFGDIGYNYLIDPNGNIYEGRFGGNGVVAGHVTGFNTGSVGISILGRYQNYLNGENEQIKSHSITSVIKKSLENLIGWLASSNNVNLNKITDFHGKKIDGVIGHRDLAPTICPGDNLYGELNNIQSQASILKLQFDKYIYQIGGDKAVYILEDGYKIKFISKDKLPSAYQSRVVKPILKSQLDRYKYQNVIIYPDGSLLQEFNVAKVYYLENGQKRSMEMTGEEFIKMGFKTSEIKKVFASDLKIYKAGKIIKYAPDGKILKDKVGNVFLMENGKKRKFTSVQLFEYLNYKWKNVEEDVLLSFYLQGPDNVYPNGTLLKREDRPDVYLIENMQKKRIFSNNLMKVLGYKAEKVLSVTRDEFNHFPEGEMLKYPDNTLLKAENFPSIYLIKDGQRKEFTSLFLFEKSGYQWQDVIITTKEEVKKYSFAGRVLYPDGLLVKSANNPTIYLLENSKKRAITSIVLFEKLGYDWNEIILLSPSEMSEYPVGQILTYPNGTLIKKKDSSAVYFVENGEKKEFTSLTLFEATRSNWSDVIELNEKEFLVYSDGGNLKYPENSLLKEKTGDKIYVIKNGGIEWIKTAKEFTEAGYKWSNILEVSRNEMKLYLNKNEVAKNEKKINSGENKQDNLNQETEDNFQDNKTEVCNDDTVCKVNKEPKMRVAIYAVEDKSEDIVITANGKYTIQYYDNKDELIKTEIKLANEKTIVKYLNSDFYLKFIPSSKNVILEILTYTDLSWDKTINDNMFRGNLEIRYSKKSQKMWVVNELPLEDYVNGVAEALSESPQEYLKSFGVIARTYAMYYIEREGKYLEEPFYLKNSRNKNGNDQVYKGYNFELRASKIVEVNKLTTGYIINYNDKPIVAAYSSDSGGTTKDACDVLSKTYCSDAYNYLRGGVNDPEGTEHNQEKILASHGAGMSAIGAYQMALNNISWQEIIKYYYLGVEIKKYY